MLDRCSALLLCLSASAAVDRYGDITITTFTHSDIQLEYAGKVIHIDPWSVSDLSKAKPADLILITDDVSHHLDPKAIARVRKPGAPVVIAGERHEAGARRHRDGERRDARDRRRSRSRRPPAYDIKPGEPYHPKGEANGYIVTHRRHAHLRRRRHRMRA